MEVLTIRELTPTITAGAMSSEILVTKAVKYEPILDNWMSFFIVLLYKMFYFYFSSVTRLGPEITK